MRTELPILDDVPGRKQFLSGCNCRVKNFICSFRFGGEIFLLLLLYIEKNSWSLRIESLSFFKLCRSFYDKTVFRWILLCNRLRCVRWFPTTLENMVFFIFSFLWQTLYLCWLAGLQCNQDNQSFFYSSSKVANQRAFNHLKGLGLEMYILFRLMVPVLSVHALMVFTTFVSLLMKTQGFSLLLWNYLLILKLLSVTFFKDPKAAILTLVDTWEEACIFKISKISKLT